MISGMNDMLNQLSKEHLIYLIDQMYSSLGMIGEICVEESKRHIDSEDAVDQIRERIYRMPSTHNVDMIRAWIDLATDKISLDEYKAELGMV